MSSTINGCFFDPTGKDNFTSINSVTPLQQNGSYDISSLIHEITTKDFGYAGNEKYTLQLRNKEMVLMLWDTPDGITQHEFATLKLENKQWTRIRPDSIDDVTVLKDSNDVSNRLAHTLNRVSKVYLLASPSSIPSPHSIPKASLDVQPHACPSVTDLEDRLKDLDLKLSSLEKSLDMNRTDLTEQWIKRLQELVDALHGKIEKLEKEMNALQSENNALKDLKDPLNKMAQDIPEALREIKNSIDQLSSNLRKMEEKSKDAPVQTLQVMGIEMDKVRLYLGRLANIFQSLQEENTALKRKAAWQENALSLKDKEITDLLLQNQKQKQLLGTLQSKLEEVTHQKEDIERKLKAAQLFDEMKQKAHDKLELQLQETQLGHEKTFASLVEATAKIEELESKVDLQNSSLENLEKHQQELEKDLKNIHKLKQQLETSYQALIEQNKKLQKANSELGEREDWLLHQLDISEKTAAQVPILEKQKKELEKLLKSVGEHQKIDAENMITLQTMNTALEQEKVELQYQITLLKSQLDTAKKTDQMSQQAIRKLGLSVEQKEKQLEEARRLTAQAEETAQKANKASKKLRNAFEEQITQINEANMQLAHTEELLKENSKKRIKTETELLLLESEFKEYQQVSNALEAEQEQRIQELETKLLNLQSKYEENLQSLGQNVDPSTIEELKKQYQLQIETLNQLLEEAKKIQSAPPIKPEKINDAPPTSPISSHSDFLAQTQQILQAVQTTDKTQVYKATNLGPILVNYALLDDSFGTTKQWLESKKNQFPDEANLLSKTQLVDIQMRNKPKVKHATKGNRSHRTIGSEIFNAQLKFEKTLQAIADLPKPLTLQSIFGMNRAFITKELIQYENTVGPLIQEYEKLGEYTDKTVSRKGTKTIPQRVDEARKLLGVVKQLKGALFETLRDKTWVTAKK